VEVLRGGPRRARPARRRPAALAQHRGTIRIDVGKGHTLGGLWALDFGIGGSNGDPNTLYFSDGINGEADGLFGAIFANGNGP